MQQTRTESDSFGEVQAPANALWGAQTARSLNFFAIGEQIMPIEFIHALSWIKPLIALDVLDSMRLLGDAMGHAAELTHLWPANYQEGGLP